MSELEPLSEGFYLEFEVALAWWNQHWERQEQAQQAKAKRPRAA